MQYMYSGTNLRYTNEKPISTIELHTPEKSCFIFLAFWKKEELKYSKFVEWLIINSLSYLKNSNEFQ